MDNFVLNSKKGLKLIVKKPGYKSVQDSVDVNPNGWTVLEMRKLGKQRLVGEAVRIVRNIAVVKMAY